MSAPSLSAHQRDALRAVLRLLDTDCVVALTGLAGTGKTTLIPHLADALPGATVAAATHKACSVLRSKGIPDARTLHSVALELTTTDAYEELEAWFFSGVGPIPRLLRSPSQRRLPLWDDSGAASSPSDVARLLGVDVRPFERRWTAKQNRGGVLIINEASMVNFDNVEQALQTFDKIVLVGDPGQLPPVEGEPALPLAAGVELTEVHRQAADSPVLRLAHAIRSGESLHRAGVRPETGGPTPDGGPIITFQNSERLRLGLMLRARRGCEGPVAQEGEPLICRATDRKSRERGFLNNREFAALDDGGVRDDAGKVLPSHLVRIEELAGERVLAGAVPFRFGHALTCHTAQGSEWPCVQIPYSEIGVAHFHKCERAWLYTAITRAKESVRFFA